MQSFAAEFNIALSFCDTFPALVALLFFGALSDKIGRKPIMILSCTLFMIETGIMLLVMYLRLPIYVIFIGVILNSLGGSFTGLSLATLAYIADITEKEKLAGRLGMFLLADRLLDFLFYMKKGDMNNKFGIFKGIVSYS